MADSAPALLELDSALSEIGRVVVPVTASEECPLSEALGRVLSCTVSAPYALPPFDNTGVDGYAFRFADLSGSPKGGLNIVGQSMAGLPYTGPTLAEGSAIQIATGAMLPSGSDTVVMQENCRRQGDTLAIKTVPLEGANIRRAGADIAKGSIVLERGHMLRPQDISVAGALGLSSVPVMRRLRIAVASTGSELKSFGDKLGPGQIIDTNSLMLKQLLASLPVVVTLLPPLADDYRVTERALREAAERHDTLITSGGISVGARDFVRDVMHSAGLIHFWKLAIKPGRPVMLGQIGKCYTVGLPGNPVSALVTFLLIVRPLISQLTGGRPSLAPALTVPLAKEFTKEKHLRVFARARLEMSPEGYRVTPYTDQSSNLFMSLVKADGLLDLPLGTEHFEAGSPVTFRPFHGLVN